MRVLRGLFGIATTLGAAYAYLSFWTSPTKVDEHPFFGNAPAPWIIAHRGGLGLAPENTMVAFARAARLGVDVLEMDLRVTSDGVLVVIHDADISRTTNGAGLVSEMTLDRLRSFDAAYHFQNDDGAFPYRGRGIQIPTFADVLARFPRARLNIEMKDFSTAHASLLCETLRDHGASERVLVAAFEHPPMARFRSKCPAVATSATMREGLLFYQLNRMRLRSLYQSPAVALQVPELSGERRVIERRFLRFADTTNVRVQVWTVNEAEDMARLLALGVQGVLTDYPDRMLDALSRSARR